MSLLVLNGNFVMLASMTIYENLQTLRLVVSESLLGGALIIGCVVIGWHIGRERQARFVCLISWWLDHIVRPLLTQCSWLRRTAVIAVNNSLVCLAMVLLGAFWSLAWLGVLFVGLGLGVAMRLLIGEQLDAYGEIDAEPDVHDENEPSKDETEHHLGWLTTIGVILNLLEVPAIMLSAGLSLSQGSLSSAVNLHEVLSAYVSIVLPMLVIAATGEALWMAMDPHLSEHMRSGGM